MSQGNPERFPWGSNLPNRQRRIAVAFAIGTVAFLILLQKFIRQPDSGTDFDRVWFGARMLWQGRDPYLLVGPGRVFASDYLLIYPATSFVVALPLTVLSMRSAALVFVFIGSALLGYGATRDGWHRLPMFASGAFLDNALAAQWSPLLVAGLFIPVLAVFACTKPQLGFAVLAGSFRRISIVAAAIGAVILLTVAFALLPTWLGEWLAAASTAKHMKVALLQPPGFLIALVLIKWRRPESWAVLVAAALPQTLSWYSFLILLAFPRTYREACVLSLVSSVGLFLADWVAETRPAVEPTGQILWAIVICTTFLPATIAILRRPNEAAHPALDVLSCG